MNKLDRIKELEAKGVYNLSKEELDELDILVKEQISLFSEKFEETVDKACEAIKNILHLEKKHELLTFLSKSFIMKVDKDNLQLQKVMNGKVNTVSYNLDTLISTGDQFGYNRLIKILTEELERGL